MERVERVTGAKAEAAAVARKLAEVRERIAHACALAGRTADSVVVVAVTKGFGPEAIEAALAAGLADIGENYFQEAQAKFAAVAWPSHPIRRHFLGRVQSNKARKIAAEFDVVQTVSDVDTAALLDDGAQTAGKKLDVLIQANVSGDRRNGVDPARCAEIAGALRRFAHIRVRGVMAIGPADDAAVPTAFASARQAFEAVRGETGADTFSLGMSGDLEAAIAAGTTMVRLGTALFGTRPTKG